MAKRWKNLKNYEEGIRIKKKKQAKYIKKHEEWFKYIEKTLEDFNNNRNLEE